MATREFLEKRVAGKELEIQKLEKKLERMNAAKATNWEVNPYSYCEWEIKYAERDLEKARQCLEDYKSKLAVQIEKDGSRNVEALVNFLNEWESRQVQFFLEAKKNYDEACKEYRKKDSEYVDWWNYHRREFSNEQVREIEKEHREYRKRFNQTWTHVTQFYHGELTWEETMRKDISKEKDRKYDDIIERTNRIVGQITDASGLRVGRAGDLNGVIVGTRGNCYVNTIGAGGYNIQCYHFRTLIKEIG